MDKMLNVGKGKRTYVIGAIIFVVAGLAGLGVITKEQADAIITPLLGVGLITLRAGVK